ncbi:MAG: hypothetical protein KDD04_01170 [Sinomicrobium sp.]|nr:hypothetical protein [Sinomicrobium sp.]
MNTKISKIEHCLEINAKLNFKDVLITGTQASGIARLKSPFPKSGVLVSFA